MWTTLPVAEFQKYLKYQTEGKEVSENFRSDGTFLFCIIRNRSQFFFISRSGT
jgi:hypothetical protein